MSKTGKISRNARPKTSAAHASREKLLRSLATLNSYATKSDISAAGMLDVFSNRNGVSLRTGAAMEEDAKELVSQGLLQWKRGASSGRDRLEIAAAGRAHIARLEADSDIEPYVAQHVQITRRDVEADGVTRNVVVDNSESPLAWLATRKNGHGQSLLNPAYFEAGERLRRDLTFAQMVPRVTANWDPSLGGSNGYAAPVTYSEVVIAAKQRADHALRAVGPEFAGLLTDVCGFLKGLELIEAERRWPRRSAKLVLELALAALARHYGLEAEAHGPAQARGIRHWGSEDYRPDITA